MTPRVRQVLEARKDTDHEYIFTDHNGNPVESTSWVFKKVVNSLFNQGVTDKRYKVCFHSLRHTFASRLVEGGTDLYATSKLMGHSSIRMTERYAHLSPDKFKDAINILHTANSEAEE